MATSNGDPGIVNQNIDGAGILDGLVHQAFNIFFLPYIAKDEDRVQSLFLQGICRQVALFFMDIA